ncbi:MAG: ATP-binding protein [Actinomycetota bacterium]|nr:ATP-binding protein [Actinomycetota bacterium]
MSGGETVPMDDIADGLVVADATGTVTHLNLAAARMLGVDRDAELGRHLSEVLALDDLGGVGWYDCIRPYDGLETRTRLVEHTWYRRDGRELLVTGRLVRERPRGAVLRVALSLRTVREREQLDRRHSDLVTTVAHELRSPLTGVKGFTATLLAKWDRFTDQQRRLMLETVDADADRLARLITELLDTARIDANRLVLRTAPVDIAVLAGRVAESIRVAGGRATVVDVPVELPEIWGDGDKLSQVVTNAIENAQRYGRGQVLVSAEAEAAADGTPGVRVLIDDEGDGVPGHLREQVFTRFWSSSHGDGSGLGLYIVRGLVEAHQGEVMIEDSPLGGARVRIWLPVGEPDSLTGPP